MSCSRREIRNSIIDYVDGNLSAQSSDSVARHLDDCPECREIEREYRRTIACIRVVFDETARNHVPNDTIVQYVDHPESLAARDREALELHVTICSSCERKIEMLREVASEESSLLRSGEGSRLQNALQRFIRVLPRRLTIRVASACAAVAVIMIIGLTMIGRDSAPRMEFTSSGDVFWLDESTRGEQTPPQIFEREGWIAVGARFHAFFDEESYQIQLWPEEGPALQTLAIDQDDYSGSGVGLRIRTSPLGPGTHHLTLISCKLTDKDFCVYTTYPFTLVKE